MPKAPIRAEIDEPLYVDGHLAPQITLNHVVPVDNFPDLQHLSIAELIDPFAVWYAYLPANLAGIDRTYAVDIAQSDDDALACWYIDARNSSHA
jgi:hypothetical protein